MKIKRILMLCLKWYNIVVTSVAIIYNNITKKRRILFHNDRSKNLKEKLLNFICKKVEPIRASQMNMEFQKRPFPNGTKNLEQCQSKAILDPSNTNELDIIQENLRLKKELEEIKKENLFLKKAAAFFAKEID